MAKHLKEKTGGFKRPGGNGQPYPKKARVEVSFEGDKTKPKSTKAASSKPHKADKAAAAKHAPPAPPKPSQVKAAAPKDKGKAKAAPKDAVVAPVPLASSNFVVVAGSYEKLLYGLEGTFQAGSDKPKLTPVFIFPAHFASVKAVAASQGGKWLATGSEDEFVKVWDLRRRKEVGSLSQHTGSITSVHFPSPSHLVTTSEDSTLSLFRTSDWALLKSLKGHSGRVNHVDVHPTGRVALSVGKDKTLKMWDLMRGRGASSLPLGTEAEMVKFSPLGTHFAVLYPKKIQVYSLTLKLLYTFTTPSRYNTLLFSLIPVAEDEEIEVICIGTEKGVVEVYMVEIGEAEESEEEQDEEDEGQTSTGSSNVEITRVGTLTGHINRIKAISALPVVVPSSTGPVPTILLSSVSSDGFINVYDLGALLKSESAGEDEPSAGPIASYDTKGTRLTVCCMADGRAVRAVHAVGRSVGGEDEDPEEEEDDQDEDGDDMYGSEVGSDEEGGLEVEMEGEEEEEEEGEEEEEEGEGEDEDKE